MAIVDVTPQQITLEGLTPLYLDESAVADGDAIHIPNNGRILVVLRNAEITPITVTFHAEGEVSGLDIADKDVVVLPGTERFHKGFPVSAFGPILKFTFSSALGLSFAAMEY